MKALAGSTDVPSMLEIFGGAGALFVPYLVVVALASAMLYLVVVIFALVAVSFTMAVVFLYLVAVTLASAMPYLVVVTFALVAVSFTMAVPLVLQILLL